MQNNAVVLDASVAVKWFHEEPDTKQAEILQERIVRGEVHAIVPPLLFYEVMNALVLKAGSEVEEIIAAHNVLRQLPLQIVEVIGGLMADAILLAHKYHLSMYDAVYVALAVFTDATLITADKKLVEAVKLPNVRLLSEIS